MSHTLDLKVKSITKTKRQLTNDKETEVSTVVLVGNGSFGNCKVIISSSVDLSNEFIVDDLNTFKIKPTQKTLMESINNE